jgi:GNAT superfamily N-acetyltransferase
MTVLVPMSEAEFARFVESTIPDYAADKVAAGQWAAAESLDLARQSLATLLPDGLRTPDQYLYSITDECAQQVGTLWLGVREEGGRRIAYIYDIEIAPAHRRQGHARRALLAAEDEARKRGLAGIGLHVFGHNAGARTLYEVLGYRATNVNMFKPL